MEYLCKLNKSVKLCLVKIFAFISPIVLTYQIHLVIKIIFVSQLYWHFYNNTLFAFNNISMCTSYVP